MYLSLNTVLQTPTMSAVLAESDLRLLLPRRNSKDWDRRATVRRLIRAALVALRLARDSGE